MEWPRLKTTKRTQPFTQATAIGDNANIIKEIEVVVINNSSDNNLQNNDLVASVVIAVRRVIERLTATNPKTLKTLTKECSIKQCDDVYSRNDGCR
ncbi:hypothetical protein Zmor_018904 [Zophobas morio]|uniref:Uncharacterized protein n=1 Tax=Zophobas morio TaxID=2755281 RepID=A0AA38ICU7_9CUCU|nr:hypothetical protein Zmor_003860 [Zophobas morio]KAJ3652983.1 hypothetical protein Zmor_018904 [Zophobas morio]